MGWSFLETNNSSWLISCQENAVLFQKHFMSIYTSLSRIMESSLAISFSFSIGES